MILDVELNMKDIKILNKNKKKLINDDIIIEDDKTFIENIETIIYEIQNSNITENSILTQLIYNDIHNYGIYLNYIKDNIQLKFPENLFEIYPLFDFNKTYKFNSSPYYSREECIKKIKIYQDDLLFEEELDKEDNIELLNFLVKKDEKIPNECLWTYYGGNKEDFIIFV